MRFRLGNTVATGPLQPGKESISQIQPEGESEHPKSAVHPCTTESLQYLESGSPHPWTPHSLLYRLRARGFANLQNHGIKGTIIGSTYEHLENPGSFRLGSPLSSGVSPTGSSPVVTT